jgi:hypothetical protein
MLMVVKFQSLLLAPPPQPLKNVQETQKLAPEDSSFLGRAQIVHFPLALRALRPIKPGIALTD